MESLRNAATVAASYVGLGSTPEDGREGEASHIAGGEAPQNVATGTSQSGVEPVSGKLGSGVGGEPYDAGNLDGAAGLGGSSAQNPSSDYTSHSTGRTHGTGATTGLGHNTTSASKTPSEPLGEKIRETFGVGGGNKYGTGLGSREEGPGYGTGSKRDKDNTLGSVIGHGSNPDKYLYNSRTAPGLGGHRIGDDFTDANTRHEGADSLPASLGSDAAAGRAKNTGAHSPSGLSSGRSDNDGYSSGNNTSGNNTTSRTGESLTQKAKEYLPGTGSNSSTASRSDAHQNTALAGAAAAVTGAGRSEHGNSTSTYGTGNPSALPVRTHESSLTGDRSLASSSLDGAGVGGTGSGIAGTGSSGLTRGHTGTSTSTGVSALTGSHSHAHAGLSDAACEAEQEGYKPHGGHPIGEAAHTTGQQTWLDYRNDPTLPVARANPADS